MAQIIHTGGGLVSAGQPEPWQEDLCNCASDPSSCCLSWWCPAVQYAYNSQAMDQSSFCGACCEYVCCGLLGCDICLRSSLRRRVRWAYNIESGCCCDCFIHWFCGCCALAQETREIARRGPPKRQMMAMPQPISIVVNHSAQQHPMMMQPPPPYMPQQVNIYKQTSGGQPQGTEMYGYSPEQQQQQQYQQYQQQQYQQQPYQPQYQPQYQQPQYQPQYAAQPASPASPGYPQQPSNAYASAPAQPVVYDYSDPVKPAPANSATGGEGEGETGGHYAAAPQPQLPARPAMESQQARSSTMYGAEGTA